MMKNSLKTWKAWKKSTRWYENHFIYDLIFCHFDVDRVWNSQLLNSKGLDILTMTN